MMTSQMKAKAILEGGGAAVSLLREYLQLRMREETENLVNAHVDAVPQLQGRIKAYQDILMDLTAAPKKQESQDPYS